MWHSIRKYGKENHICEIQEHWFSRKDLALREKEIVNEELLEDLMCMNLCLGGEIGFTTEQVRLGRINANKVLNDRYKNDPAYREKLSIAARNSYLNGTRQVHYFYDWTR